VNKQHTSLIGADGEFIEADFSIDPQIYEHYAASFQSEKKVRIDPRKTIWRVIRALLRFIGWVCSAAVAVVGIYVIMFAPDASKPEGLELLLWILVTVAAGIVACLLAQDG
jgi:hypothetical protein